MSTRRLAAVLLTAVVVVSACSKGGAGASNAGAGGGGAGSSLNIPLLPAAGGGSCTVNITGDITKSWTSNQTQGSLLVSYWLSSAELSALSLTKGDAYFIMNCTGTDGSVSFTLNNNTTTAQFPEGPGSYVISATGGLTGLGGDAGQVGMIMDLKDSSIWNATEPGSFKITTFGGGKFQGTFQVKLGKLGDDLKTVTATATMSGTFNYGCTSLGCN